MCALRGFKLAVLHVCIRPEILFFLQSSLISNFLRLYLLPLNSLNYVRVSLDCFFHSNLENFLISRTVRTLLVKAERWHLLSKGKHTNQFLSRYCSRRYARRPSAGLSYLSWEFIEFFEPVQHCTAPRNEERDVWRRRNELIVASKSHDLRL